jgi:hypothetical protein
MDDADIITLSSDDEGTELVVEEPSKSARIVNLPVVNSSRQLSSTLGLTGDVKLVEIRHAGSSSCSSRKRMATSRPSSSADRVFSQRVEEDSSSSEDDPSEVICLDDDDDEEVAAAIAAARDLKTGTNVKKVRTLNHQLGWLVDLDLTLGPRLTNCLYVNYRNRK